jgi:hypothetical protein
MYNREISLSFVNFIEVCNFLVNSVKGQEIFAKFDQTDLKISLNIHCILLTFVYAMQNGQFLASFIMTLTKIWW